MQTPATGLPYGAITHDHNRMDIVETYAPTLRDEWLSLRPFMDVINSCGAGPQPQSKHDSMDEPQHIDLDFSEWHEGEIIALRVWIIRKDGVVLLTEDGESESSLEKLWSFLRQLPRPAYSFAA